MVSLRMRRVSFPFVGRWFVTVQWILKCLYSTSIWFRMLQSASRIFFSAMTLMSSKMHTDPFTLSTFMGGGGLSRRVGYIFWIRLDSKKHEDAEYVLKE